MTYPGGKNGAGVYQRIINLIPPHRVYIEPFAGGAAIARRKRPAASTIVVERDPKVRLELRAWLLLPGLTVIEGDGIEFLRGYPWRGDEFVYCDPPYVLSSLSGAPHLEHPLYQYWLTDDQHAELLSVLLTIPAGVMLSGYRTALYDEALSSWHRVDYQATTRGGSLADESLWLNYAPPALLHDTRYLGRDFRERERIKRKRERWVSRLLAMPPAERFAVYGSLVEAMRDRATSSSPTAPMRTASTDAAVLQG